MTAKHLDLTTAETAAWLEATEDADGEYCVFPAGPDGKVKPYYGPGIALELDPVEAVYVAAGLHLLDEAAGATGRQAVEEWARGLRWKLTAALELDGRRRAARQADGRTP